MLPLILTLLTSPVVAIPMVVYQPVDVMYVDVETTAELTCESSEPLESGTGISWYRKSWRTGGNISLVKSCAKDNGQNKYVCNNSHNTTTLLIRNTQTSDSGDYICASYHNNFGNGTALVVGERSTCEGSVHLLTPIQQPFPIRTVQLACVVHGVHHAVHITWIISGIHSKGKITSIQRSDGTRIFMNMISLPREEWNHDDWVICKVWLSSIRVLVHLEIPIEDAQKTFVSACSLYLRSVLTAIVLVICMVAVHLSHTYKS
ncbi:uncharacterized protein [Ranitomeya imitator]|uniref:uncharacterized protein n=1 Tax=Ranitomeya imitator TaxID=111125 RepID=UPI0037E8D656